jgi:hypothetical protein
VLDNGAHAGRGAFRAQRQLFAIERVFERVHFFFNDVGDLADGALEQRGLLDDGRADFTVAVGGEPVVHHGFKVLPARAVLGQYVVHATNGLERSAHESIVYRATVGRVYTTAIGMTLALCRAWPSA